MLLYRKFQRSCEKVLFSDFYMLMCLNTFDEVRHFGTVRYRTYGGAATSVG